MLIQEYNFREIYHRFLKFNVNPDMDTFKDIKFPKETDSFVTYCYIDEQCGITFEYICPYSNKNKKCLRRDLNGTSIKFRYGSLNYDVEIINGIDVYEGDTFIKEILDIIDNDYDNKHLAVNREFKEIDNLRCEGFPYDIKVFLVKNGFNNEIVWVTWNYVEKGICFGILKNEPFQDMGVHLGDRIQIILAKKDDGEWISFCNCNEININAKET